MVRFLNDPLWMFHWKIRNSQRKFSEFGIFDRDTGELVQGGFASRGQAEAHKTKHHYRVRGVCK